MATLLESRNRPPVIAAHQRIGDRVPLPSADDAAKSTIIRKPDGNSVTLPARTKFFEDTDQPGLYTINTAAGPSSFAVNLDPLESKTEPLHVETIEQFGVRLANHFQKNVDREQLRQMYSAELEGRQKLWRWLILAVIGILILETWVARANRRSSPFISGGGRADMRTELRRALEQVARRFRSERLWTGLTLCWLIWAVVGVCLWLIGLFSGERWISDGWLVVFLGAVVATGIGCAVLAVRSVKDVRWVARRIEARYPELGTGLLAAIEEDARASSGRLGFLQSAVIRQAINHHRRNNWDETVPTWRIRLSQLAHATTLGLLIAVAIALASQAHSQAELGTSTVFAANASDVQVDPGDTEVERGTPLLVVAHFKGGVPAEANLVVDDEAQKTTQRIMTRSLEDPDVRRPRRIRRCQLVVPRAISRKEYEGLSCACV